MKEANKNETSSYESDVISPVDKAIENKQASAKDNEDCCQAIDLNKLKEDMNWINLQIENETPLKNQTTIKT